MRKNQISGLLLTLPSAEPARFRKSFFFFKCRELKVFMTLFMRLLKAADWKKKEKKLCQRRTNLSAGRIFGDWRHERVCHLRASAIKSKQQLITALLTQWHTFPQHQHSSITCCFLISHSYHHNIIIVAICKLPTNEFSLAPLFPEEFCFTPQGHISLKTVSHGPCWGICLLSV